MTENLIMFSSITFAIKSRDLLNANKISSKLTRTPMNLKTNSCGYSLYVPNNIDKAINIIRSNGITILGKSAVSKL